MGFWASRLALGIELRLDVHHADSSVKVYEVLRLGVLSTISWRKGQGAGLGFRV